MVQTNRIAKSRALRKIPIGISCLTFVSVICLLGLEIGVRLFSREGESLLVKDDAIGQRYQRNFDGVRYVPEANRSVRLRFNDMGFRGPDLAESKSAETIRVAILGDSFVASIGVDQSETMTAQLADQLNAKAATPRFATMNFGVSGFGTAQELLTWRHVVRDQKPDLVVLCFYNGNDLSDNCERLSTANRPYFTFDDRDELLLHPMSASRNIASRWLSEHSRLYVWQKNQMRVARDRLRDWSGNLPPGFAIFRRNPPAPFDEAWRLTEKLLLQIKTEVAASGAEFLLAQIPCHEQIYDRDWQNLLKVAGADAGNFRRENPEERIAEVCSRHGIERVSLLPALQGASKDAELFFPGNGHWNDRGNKVAAAALADVIAKIDRLSIAKKPGPSVR